MWPLSRSQSTRQGPRRDRDRDRERDRDRDRDRDRERERDRDRSRDRRRDRDDAATTPAKLSRSHTHRDRSRDRSRPRNRSRDRARDDGGGLFDPRRRRSSPGAFAGAAPAAAAATPPSRPHQPTVSVTVKDLDFVRGPDFMALREGATLNVVDDYLRRRHAATTLPPQRGGVGHSNKQPPSDGARIYPDDHVAFYIDGRHVGFDEVLELDDDAVKNGITVYYRVRRLPPTPPPPPQKIRRAAATRGKKPRPRDTARASTKGGGSDAESSDADGSDGGSSGDESDDSSLTDEEATVAAEVAAAAAAAAASAAMLDPGPGELELTTYRRGGKEHELGMELRRALVEQIEAGKSVGEVRITAAMGLGVDDPNRIVLVARGGMRPGSLAGNAWQVHHVREWLSERLSVEVQPRRCYVILRGLDREYLYQPSEDATPRVNLRGHVDVYAVKRWMQQHLLSAVHKCNRSDVRVRPSRIDLSLRGRRLRDDSEAVRWGDILYFDLPEGVADAFEREETWWLPFTESCAVCVEDKRTTEMPRRITRRCEHLPSTCKECLAQWISTSMESVMWDQLRCPECPQMLRYKDVQAFAQRDVFDKYDTLAVRAVLNKIPNFFFCLNDKCGSGHIHDNGCAKFECEDCGSKACINHEVPWHRGETCDQYDRRNDKRRQDERRSKKFIKKTSKQCPRCNRDVFKYAGCNHITCRCGHHWCYVCLGPYPEHNEGCTEDPFGEFRVGRLNAAMFRAFGVPPPPDRVEQDRARARNPFMPMRGGPPWMRPNGGNNGNPGDNNNNNDNNNNDAEGPNGEGGGQNQPPPPAFANNNPFHNNPFAHMHRPDAANNNNNGGVNNNGFGPGAIPPFAAFFEAANMANANAGDANRLFDDFFGVPPNDPDVPAQQQQQQQHAGDHPFGGGGGGAQMPRGFRQQQDREQRDGGGNAMDIDPVDAAAVAAAAARRRRGTGAAAAITAGLAGLALAQAAARQRERREREEEELFMRGNGGGAGGGGGGGWGWGGAEGRIMGDAEGERIRPRHHHQRRNTMGGAGALGVGLGAAALAVMMDGLRVRDDMD